MRRIHFLNVKNGDCSIIEHSSGRVTVIDVSNARMLTEAERSTEALLTKMAVRDSGISGNFNQKNYPTNPIAYLADRGIDSVFRFILTHPDMDHLDGIKSFFEAFSPANFWDTDNEAEKNFDNGYSSFSKGDWDFYKSLRDTKPSTDPKRLTLFSGARGKYFNSVSEGDRPDGISVLAPTPELLKNANECGLYNDSSYVLLYAAESYKDFKVVFGGDAEDDTWDHIITAHAGKIEDIDLLIAPHHGRRSEGSFDYLDALRPRLTLIGNAPSEYLAYEQWRNRNLDFITNNQGGNVVLDIGGDSVDVYVSHEPYARRRHRETWYNEAVKGWYCMSL